MANLIISNIGPIEHVEIQLNRFNVFIGPQGSGKSTVAKILSFCQWIEKDCVRRQMISHFNEDDIKSLLIDYHNMNGYLSSESHFRYEGHAVIVELKDGNFSISKLESFYFAPVSKNAYIPAERNIIAVPGIFTTKMPHNYILDFLDDWQTVRDKYHNGENVDILDLNQSYVYDKTQNVDYIESLIGEKRFPLSQVSSGLQSVTPLCVMIDYLTKWIYSHKEERSAEERQTLRDAAIARYMAQKEDAKGILELSRVNETIRQSLNNLSTAVQSSIDMNITPTDAEPNFPEVNELFKIISSLDHPSFSNIVIEEPELNLFPTTQIRLLYYILSKINHTRDRMVVTTHSPYILYALNNCMLAHMVSNHTEVSLEDISEIPESAIINPKYICLLYTSDAADES